MANTQHDPVVAQLERQKLTLVASLTSVAEQMRHCANVADQFAQMLTQSPFGTNMASTGAVHAGSKRPGTEEDDVEGGNKKRRTRKIRDPDLPKRAASSYIFFQNDLRPELRKQHPDISTADIMARVKKRWAEMTPEQKAPYERQQAEAKHKWETEMRAYDERRGIVAPTKPVNRKMTAAVIEEPVQPATGAKLAQKTLESSDSSDDTNSSDKSEEEEDGIVGDSGDEEEIKEDEPAPSPPLSKSKAKRKAEVATTTTGKPKGRVSSSAVISSRPEKKKRSKV